MAALLLAACEDKEVPIIVPEGERLGTWWVMAGGGAPSSGNSITMNGTKCITNSNPHIYHLLSKNQKSPPLNRETGLG